MHAITAVPPRALNAYQADIWLAGSAAPAGHAQFNAVVSERLSGEIDVPLLRSCLERALNRNDAFSLRFDERDGVPVQWVHDEPAVVAVLDFSGHPDPAAAITAWRDESFHRGFALRQERMYEAALLLEGPGTAYLYLRVHHLLVDGWALNEARQQVWADYEHALVTGESTDVLAPAYLGSSAAATPMAGHRPGDGHRADVEYYRDALAGVEPALFKHIPLPGESARFSGRRSFTVPVDVVAGIKRAGCSVFPYVAAVFATYLSRVHGVDDVVLGVPFLNRHSVLDRRTVGRFANTLPLRVAVDPDLPLARLAGRIRETIGELKAHERLPLSEIVSAAGGPRRLFDVRLSYLNPPQSRQYPQSPQIPGVRRDAVMSVPLHGGEALSVVIRTAEDSGELVVDLDYALDVFDADLPIDGLVRQLRSLVCAGVEQPGSALGDLPLLSWTERAKTLQLGRGTEVEFAQDETLAGLFAGRAARNPGRVALRGDDPVTYAELDEASGRVSCGLLARGVQPEDRVAVLVPRGPELLPALLGVLKAGAAYVLVDPGQPAERIRYLLENSRAAMVLTGDGVPGQGVSSVPVSELLAEVQDRPEILDAVPEAENLAYVLYPSDSQERPKGVMVEHRSVVNRLAWMQSRYPIGENDVLLQKTPVSFDASVRELFWWAVEGASLALLPPGGERDPRVIAGAVAAHGVTVLEFVPSMFGPFLDLFEKEPALREQVRSLRLVVCSGEALPPAYVTRFGRLFGAGGPKLVNLYGPAEATGDVSYHDCAADGPVSRVPIGRPIDNLALYVLDPRGEAQPPGVAGELWIGGAGVARGYLDHPDLTAERFVDDPCTPGGRLYRTGDLVRWLADGELEYLGRLDGEETSQGNRAELDALVDVPEARDPAAAGNRTEVRGTQLVA
jgi:amino acid adenylation domain-containing protein